MLNLKVDTWRRAALETLVIAVGVFAALAADNWNEARKERLLELEFLNGIVLDLEFNIEEVEFAMRTAERNRDSLMRVIATVQEGETASGTAEELVLALVTSTYLRLPRLSSITFDELQSSASLRIVGDDSFRRELADYYRRFEDAAQFHPEYRRKEAAAEEALAGLLPLQERLEISQTNELQETDADLPSLIDELRSRPDLIARLEDMVWVQDRVQTRYTWVIETSRELLNEIGAMRGE